MALQRHGYCFLVFGCVYFQINYSDNFLRNSKNNPEHSGSTQGRHMKGYIQGLYSVNTVLNISLQLLGCLLLVLTWGFSTKHCPEHSCSWACKSLRRQSDPLLPFLQSANDAPNCDLGCKESKKTQEKGIKLLMTLGFSGHPPSPCCDQYSPHSL